MAEKDPFDLDTDEDDEGQDQEKQNQSFTELRQAFNRTKRELKAEKEARAELEGFKAGIAQEKRDSAITAAFTEVGLNPKHAKFFVVEEGVEVTTEMVRNFAAENDFPTVSGEVPEAQEKPTGFSPINTGSPNTITRLSSDDITDLLKKGRSDEVEKAYREGRVEKEPVPWTVLPT